MAKRPGGWDVSRYIASAEQAGKWALKREADRVLEASRNLVPLNKDPDMEWHKGTLQRSGETIVAEDAMSVTIKYSVLESRNDFYDYALIQHENTEYSHETGQPFYLKETVDDMEADVVSRIGAAIADSLRRTR